MTTQVLKIEVNRPLNTDVKTFNKAIRYVQYQCDKLGNKAITLQNKQFMSSKKKVRIFRKKKDSYFIVLSLLTKPKAHGIFHLELNITDNAHKAIVEGFISGEYKLSMTQMQYDTSQKKWFFLFTYKAQTKPLDKTRILGMDLGIKIPVMLAVSDNPSFSKAIGNSNDIKMLNNLIQKQKKHLQNVSVGNSKGANKHGLNTHTTTLDKIGEKIANIKKTKIHSVIAEVINVALREKCGTIQMEDLKSGLYLPLQEMIIDKAKKHGIKVVKIEPSYTSQRCHKCGCIDKRNRRKQEKFKCISCAYQCNSDLNASHNIATKGIETIIKKHLQRKAPKDVSNR